MTAPIEDACIFGHAEPVERDFGFACSRHYHWIDRTLGQILELFALLDDVLIPGPSGDGRSGTRVGSPAPGRVDVMALTDPRNAGRMIPMTPYLNADGRGFLESNGEDVPDLPGMLASWARMTIEELYENNLERQALELDGLDGTVAVSVRVLRRERQFIVRQPWVDEYADELHDLHRAVASAAGDGMWPRPIGKCPNCATPMYPTIGVDEATCRKCHKTWTGIHLARLRLIHEQEQAQRTQGASS